MKPLDNRIIVHEEVAKDTTDSGIILADSNKKRKCVGKVVAVGPKVNVIKVGDSVMYPEYSGTTVVANNVVNLILRETEVMAILEDKWLTIK